MKKWKKLLFCIFLLPVIFVMSGCTPFGGDSTLTTEQTQESTTDQTESEGENQKPQQPANPDYEADENEKPNEGTTQPENPDGDMTEPENPAEEEKPIQPEKNQFFIVDFEVKCFDSTTAAIQKSDTPMSISAMYPDIQIQSNDGILFFVDDYFNTSQYAIHFKHSHEKEICTTLENGKQVLEFDIYYSIPFCQSTIFVNGNAVASLPFTEGFEKMSVRVEVFSNSTFTLDLTAIM